MRPGRMDRRIVIQQRADSQDAAGEPIPTWSTLATVAAEVRPTRGREFTGGAQTVAEREALFRIRYRSDVTADMRISYSGRLWDIRYIAEIGRREGLEITATAQGV